MFSPRAVGPRRFLTVQVIEAKGLLAVETNGMSDPYAVVSVMLEDRITDDGKHETKTIKGTLAPQWKSEPYKFGDKFDLNKNGPRLQVQVFDKNTFGKDKELGEATVHWTPDGLDTDEWHKLEPFGNLRRGASLGEIRLKIKVDPVTNVSATPQPSVRANDAQGAVPSRTASQLDMTITGHLPDQSDEALEHQGEAPNLLKVKVVQASGLRVADKNLFGGGSSDPLVKLMVDGCDDQKTKVVKENLAPQWNESFDFFVVESSKSLELRVEDDDLTSNDFLGRVSVHMDELKHKQKIRRWFDLLEDDGSRPQQSLGGIELEMQWYFDPAAEGKAGKKTNIFGGLLKVVGIEDKDEDTEGEDEVDEKAPEMTEEEKKAQEKEAAEQAEKDAKLKEQLGEIEVKSGDYMIYVHIIEARDLKGEDPQGTSDPVVKVSAFGQNFSTEVKDNCLSAVWDETFVISCRNLDKEEFEQGVIRIAVMDADGPPLGAFGTAAIKSDLIGAYSFDATFVYSQLNHEIHRKWLALNDDEDPKDVGVQGYLKMSVAIVGPDDKLKVHDEEADRIKEREDEAKAGGFDKLVLMPATIERKQQWLVTTVWKAEYLPVMDESLLGKGGDYYFKMSVAGGKDLLTRRETVKGTRSSLNPAWRTELWYPVTMPCASGNIKYHVMDFETVGEDEVVGSFAGRIKDINACPGNKLGPRWVYLYGAPLKVPPPDVSALARKISEKVDWKVMYTNYPDKGSTYRGRVMISEEIRFDLPKEHEDARLPWRRRVKAINPSLEPSSKKYSLACYIASGTEIPETPDLLKAGTSNLPMSIRISCGKYEVATALVANDDGVCTWNEKLEIPEMNLPVDAKQLPDVMVHLLRGKDLWPVCFMRFKAAVLLDQKFTAGAKWETLGEDKVMDALANDQFPGSLLMRLGMGVQSLYVAKGPEWNKQQDGVHGKKFPYEVRLHIYQCRDLPPSDDNGLMDPYLKLRLLGHKKSTEDIQDANKKYYLRRRATTDPSYFYTHTWNVELVDQTLKEWFPQIKVQVYDWDMFGSHEYCGQLFVPLTACTVESADNIGPPPDPSWMKLFKETPGDTSGEALLSWQVIRKEKGEELPKPPSLVPETREAWVEAIVIGIRDMEPFQMLPMQLPFVELEVDVGKDEKRTITTEASHKPTGTDANFLQRTKVKLPLPVEEIFAPRMKIRVFDTRLGGFLKPLVGTGHVDLLSKLPWGSMYVPPTCNAIDSAALLAAAKEESEKMAFAKAAEGVEETKSSDLAGTATRLPPLGTPAPVVVPKSAPAVPPNAAVAALAAASGGTSIVRSSSIVAAGRNPSFAGALSRTASLLMAGAPAAGVGVGGLGNAGANVGTGEDQGLGVLPALLKTTAGDGGPPRSEAEAKQQMQQVKEKVSGKKTVGEGGKDVDGIGEPEEDEVEGPPKYMINRRKMESELEAELLTTPFETYKLFRGCDLDYKHVGNLKCILRVTVEDPDLVPLFVHVDEYKDKGGLAAAQEENARVLNELLRPKGYKVRLYVLQGLNLTPMDVGIGGRPGKSDPYLKVMLGRETFDDSANFIEDVTDADLYKCIELNAELPGASQLNVAVMDYDDFGSDDTIGRTVIDLEDRWFDQRWQAMGMENRREQDGDNNVLRWQTKPLERRSLYVSTCKAPQGVLECWVDIMTTGDASAFPPDDVALPPAADFEVRVVIWKCKDVVAMDTLENMNDLFVKAWVEGCDPIETDTHWRAKKGKGSFNWRMKFKVSLGPRARATKFPYLTVQMWDRDVIKWNDIIAEGMFDMGAAFRRAYKKKEVVKLFTQVDPAKVAKAKEAAAMAANDAANAAKDNGPAGAAGSVAGEGESLLASNVTSPRGGGGTYNMSTVASPPSSVTDGQTGGGGAVLPARSAREPAVAGSPGDPLARPSGNLTVPLVGGRPLSDDDDVGGGLSSTRPKSGTGGGGGGGQAAGQPLRPAPAGSPTSSRVAGAGTAAVGGGPAAAHDNGGGVMDRLTAMLFVEEGGAAAPAPGARPAGAMSAAGTGGAPAAAGARKRAPAKVAAKGGKKDPEVKTATELERENERRKELGLPEVTAADYKTAEDDGGDDDAKEFIRSLKEMTGLWEDDPMESHWMHLERTNRKTGKKEPMGKCCIGIQVWPVEKAAVQPVGFGRSEPNNTPYMPPPAGRLKFSFNPFVMGAELFGPKICCYIMCFCICCAIILLLIFCQPLLNLIIAISFN